MSPASPRARAQVAERTPAERGRPLWSRLLRSLLALVLLLGLAGVAMVAFLYTSIDIPQANPATQAQVSTVYFADGRTEMGRLSGGTNRVPVPLSQVPDHVQKAFLAAEDRSFYTNKGISPSGLARAVKVAAQGGSTQGGSTITQQYVKNTFLTSDQTMQRKVKEMVISVKLDQQRSKDEILEGYLNTIYFGRGASGVQAASEAYFRKDVARLTPAEGALLASVIRGPSIYDPARSEGNLRRSKERVAWILDAMVEQGWLDASRRSGAVYPAVSPPKPIEIVGGTEGYLVSMVQKELTTLAELDEDQVKKGGLKVVTTIEPRYQDAMVEAIADKGADNDIEGAQTGMAAVEPGTGEIKALYGGSDFRERPFNNAVDAHLSAGSTFKAYTTVAALQEGYSTRSRVSGASPYEVRGAAIENEFNQQFGFVDVRQALADSVNTAFVRINDKIGPAATKKAAVAAGIPDTKAVNLEDNLTNTLGTATPSVLDNTNGFATIAAEGRRATPHIIRSAESADGEVDYQASTKTVQAFDKDVAIDTTEALTHPITEGTATRARRLGRPAAGKTGTAEDHREVWFVGYVPQLAAGCAIYKPDDKGNNEPLGRNVGGYKYCVPIWTQFMRTVLEDVERKDFPERVGVNDRGRKNFSTAPKVRVTPTGEPTGDGGATPAPEGGDEPSGTATSEPEEDDTVPAEPSDDESTRTAEPAPTGTRESRPTTQDPGPMQPPRQRDTAPAPSPPAPVEPTPSAT